PPASRDLASRQPHQDDGLWGGTAGAGRRGGGRIGSWAPPRTPRPGAESPSARTWPGLEPELAVRDPRAAERLPRPAEGAGGPAGRGPQGAAGELGEGLAASRQTSPRPSLHRPALCSQVRFRLAPLSPVRSDPTPAAAAPSEKPAAPQDLGAPAQQSSLALSLELQAARAAAEGQFDAAKAVEEQLRKSFQTRCGLEESVAEGLNVPRSKRLFRDLVSLQVPEEQVLNAALREKLALLPPQARAPPPKEPPGSGPDMTILCDPETLFYESPHLTLDGLPPLRLQLRPRPSEDTFLMHRTLRRWEA
uniref:Protein phosphatase 1 regulatory subunit 35 n=1 Tax=Mustela putorius furo TaxID=9669 RepID=M3YW57_MUSPF